MNLYRKETVRIKLKDGLTPEQQAQAWSRMVDTSSEVIEKLQDELIDLKKHVEFKPCLRCKEAIYHDDNYCTWCGYEQRKGIIKVLYKIYWYFSKDYKNPVDELVTKKYYDNNE